MRDVDLTEADAEDREYHSVDILLPKDQQCGHRYRWGRVCDRRAGHVNERHRDGEISWTDEMAAQEAAKSAS